MRPNFLHNDANYGVNFLNTTTYVSLLSVDCAWFVSRLYHAFIARTNPQTLRGLARALARVLYNTMSKLPFFSSKRTLASQEVSLGQKEECDCPVVRLTLCPVQIQRKPEPRNFFAERPRREKLSHRPPRTIVDALSKVELHRCLQRCVRKCKGVGDVGPKLGTHVLDRGAREYFVLLISRAIVA